MSQQCLDLIRVRRHLRSWLPGCLQVYPKYSLKKEFTLHGIRIPNLVMLYSPPEVDRIWGI